MPSEAGIRGGGLGRRSFLALWPMFAGLAISYGTAPAYGIRYIFGRQAPPHMLQVLIANMADIPVGGSLLSDNPANPAVTPEHIKPEWHFYPVFRWLKLFPFQAEIISALLAVLIMFAWPWIDRTIEQRAKGKDFSIYVGIIAVIA